MSGGREWAMTLDVECRVEPCTAKDTASVASTSSIDATEGVRKVLRHRGWTLDRREDTCPAHSGPIPSCTVCGAPTPKPYGIPADHIVHGYSCKACHYAALQERVRETFAKDLARCPTPPTSRPRG